MCFTKESFIPFLFQLSFCTTYNMHFSYLNALLVYMTLLNKYYIISFCSDYRGIDSTFVNVISGPVIHIFKNPSSIDVESKLEYYEKNEFIFFQL